MKTKEWDLYYIVVMSKKLWTTMLNWYDQTKNEEFITGEKLIHV